MSLPMNSDYEVISNAEVSAIISKYSSGMIDMSLREILAMKGNYHINPLANMVLSLETNFKIDLNKIPEMGQQMIEQRTNLYSYIIDTICQFHNISYTLPENTDMYTYAYYIYQFLVSDFYHLGIMFYVNILRNESKEISRILESNDAPIHQYSKKRYSGKFGELAVINTNIMDALQIIKGMDIDIYTIIDILYKNSEVGILLKNSLVDTGNFFRTFYFPILDKPESITTIRLNLLGDTIDSNHKDIKDYIKGEE